MNIRALLLTLVTPLPYWILGLPWLLGTERSDERLRLSPLVGCAISGLAAELALIAGAPVRLAVGACVLVSAGAILMRWRRDRSVLAGAFLKWVPIYLVAVLAASISPFPVLGNWSGDWLLLYQMGQAVAGGTLPADMLARPPLFGAATAPLWIVGTGLIPYQLMAAAASASAVTAATHVLRAKHAFGFAVFLPLLLSPFFLHHTAAAWSKLLAAGLIVAAAGEGLRGKRFGSAALFALSVAVHESSIIWLPCVLIAHGAGGAGWRGIRRALWPMLAMGLLLAAPLQIWILAKYGVAAKISANPVVTDRTETPLLLKTLHAIVATFVGWGPGVSLVRWLRNPLFATPAVLGKEGYWLVTSWITTLAGTLAGLLVPFLAAPRAFQSLRQIRTAPLSGLPLFAAFGFALVMSGLLPGFSSNEGTMQNAFSAVALVVYMLLATHLSTQGGAEKNALRKVALVTAVIGTLPWFLLNAGTAVGLWLSSAFRQRMFVGSEGDFFRILDNHLAPLGMNAFPEVPILCVALLAGLYVLRRRQQRRSDLRVQSRADLSEARSSS